MHLKGCISKFINHQQKENKMNEQQLEKKIHAMKVTLAASLEQHKQRNGLTQVTMGKLCGINQAKYSRIANGHFHGVTVEFLIKLNLKVGTDFKLLDFAKF
ncbi:MAG: XRE family transcriptional regulator [Colwellia sp.]|nr:XRE family transcriptional regulator [Colwellia sp.]